MKFVRILSFFLAIVLSLAVFVGCGDKTAEETTSNPDTVENEEELHPDIAKNDYGSEFYFTIMTHVNQPELYWAEEYDDNALTSAVYNRQEFVGNYLGVEIFGISEGNPTDCTTKFQAAVKNRDDSTHMLLSHTFMGVDGFVTGNYLTDFNEIDVIDTTADHWNYDFMDEVSINGHMFLGYSDFNIARTQVVAFNKDMYSKYEDAIGEEFYDMVEEYRWTLDKMIAVANLVYIDEGQDGKTENDTFGLTADYEVPYASFLQACNISVVDVNDKGAYVIAVYNEENRARTSALVDKLYDFVRSDGAFFSDDPTYLVPGKIFAEDRALMYLARTTSLPGFLNDDINFGVLPYPMFDENQKNVGYRSLQWGGYICIPSYLADPDMAYETIELLSWASDKVNIAYYEKLLGKQVADAPQDKKMLDLVWDSVCSDFGLTYSQVTERDFHYFMLRDLTMMGSTAQLASYVSSNEGTANKRLSKFTGSVK